MAVAIPLLAVAGGVSAGMAMAAGAAVTFASAMAVAGGMMAGLGLISNDKDMQRMGSMLSAVSGLSGAFTGGANAAATAGAAESAGGLSAEAAGLGAETGSLGAGYNFDGIGNYSGVGAAPTPGAGLGQAAGGAGAAGQINPQAAGLGQASQDIASSLTGSEGGLLAKAYQTAQTAPPGAAAPVAQTPAGALSEVAQGITQNDITAMLQRGADKAGSLMGQAWDGAGKVLNSAGQWVQKNPQAASMVFNALGNAYGPEAEAMDLRKSLMDRARQNSNSPVRLQYLTPKTV